MFCAVSTVILAAVGSGGRGILPRSKRSNAGTGNDDLPSAGAFMLISGDSDLKLSPGGALSISGDLTMYEDIG